MDFAMVTMLLVPMLADEETREGIKGDIVTMLESVGIESAMVMIRDQDYELLRETNMTLTEMSDFFINKLCEKLGVPV